MQKSNLLLAVVTLFLFSFMVSCSDKDDTEPQDQQTQQAPTIETQVVELPEAMTQSNDPGATQATIYVNMANAFVGWSSLMVPPEKSVALKSVMDGDPWVYTWDYSEGNDVYSITLTINETSTEYMWTMVINGTVDGMVLNDFMYMEASELLDGSSGTFVMYDWDTYGIGMMVSWSTDSNGVYTAVFEVPNEIKIETISNPDGSGSVKFYEFYETEYMLEFHAEWTAAGTGQWWEYYMGELIDEGFWPNP